MANTESVLLSVVQVLDLRTGCLEKMVQNVTADTVFGYLMAADKHAEPELRQACTVFAVDHR